jgi:hypothetical protein
MDLNAVLAKLLTEGNSIRGASRILNMSYSSTYKKFLWFRKLLDHEQHKLVFSAQTVQFDEQETIHHTKCKPLHIMLAVNEKYQLISAEVAEMPAKGHLAEISRKKYGPRKNERQAKLHELFSNIKNKYGIFPQLIKSDKHPSYVGVLRAYYPDVVYEQYRRVDKDRLQSRLHEKRQKKCFDPLFAVNHLCARLRDRTRRLARRNWSTTKKPENLKLQLDLYIAMQFNLQF